MLHAAVDGLLAGYGIAIPVGAIAVLIVDTGIRSGFRPAAAAGAGAATADLVYAAVAVAGGTAIARAIASVATPFRYASAGVLAAIAVIGLLRAGRGSPAAEPAPGRSRLWRTYRTFVGMTLVNPLTVVYFTVFVVGSGLAAGLGPATGAVFVLTAFAASLSWQTALAGIGGLGHRSLSPRFRTGASVLGNLVVLALAVGVALR
jgi:arginine exporter protein ArgO